MKIVGLLFIALVLATIDVFGGAISRIGSPTILPFVKHKILVLEFDTPEKTAWGKEISQVLAQEILGSLKGVTGAGVITLRQPEHHITLTADTVIGIARQNNGLVVIWGEFYRERDAVFLHTHLRIVPQAGFPESGLGLEYYPKSGGELISSPPTLQVNFLPIEVSVHSLETLQTFFEQTVVLHETPSPDSRVIARLKEGDTYYPLKVQKDWIEIRMTGNKTGWIRYATLGSQMGLGDLRGIRIYAQGVLQYIGGNFAAAEQSMQSYLNEFGGSQDAMNKALAHILLGNARWRAAWGADLRPGEKVSQEYQEAVALLPNSSSPVAYLMIARVAAISMFSRRECLDKMQEVEGRLIHVLQTENDLQTVRNLLSFYRVADFQNVLQKPEVVDFQYHLEIQQRREQLEEIERKLIH